MYDWLIDSLPIVVSDQKKKKYIYNNYLIKKNLVIYDSVCGIDSKQRKVQQCSSLMCELWIHILYLLVDAFIIDVDLSMGYVTEYRISSAFYFKLI